MTASPQEKREKSPTASESGSQDPYADCIHARHERVELQTTDESTL